MSFQPIYLTNLPKELYTNICSYLTYLDLIDLLKSCSKFLRIIKEQPISITPMANFEYKDLLNLNKYFPNCTGLNFQLCRKLDFVKKKVFYPKNLQFLCLNGSQKIDDLLLSTLNKYPLKTLSLKRCRKITDLGLFYISILSLSILDLTGCSSFSDFGLRQIKYLRIKVLNLEDCTQISDESIRSLNFSSLTSLNLSGCPKITDQTLQFLARTPLKCLLLRNCPKITDQGVYYLRTSSIKRLDLSRCQNISIRSIFYLNQTSIQILNIGSIRFELIAWLVTEKWNKLDLFVHLEGDNKKKIDKLNKLTKPLRIHVLS